MARVQILAAMSSLLAGCDVTYATFVTSTHLGIKADTKTEQVAVGIGRTDLFVGPGYPETGTAPSAFGYLQTNGDIFDPKVTQLYATGEAANTVTQQGSVTQPQESPELSGVRRPLVFGTNTDFGLKVGFVANTPSSINVGYNREEVSIIPMRPTLGAGDKDAYAPVLGALSLNVNTAGLSTTGVGLGQFFATGRAAVNLAARDEIRALFKGTAQAQVNQAALQAAIDAANSRVAAIKAVLDGPGGFAANCARLKASPKFHSENWEVPDPCGLTEDQFIKKLNGRLDLTSTTFDSIPANP